MTEADKKCIKGGKDKRHEGFHLVDKIYDAIKDYMLWTGGSVFKIFKELDKDQSNKINAKELFDGLKKIGLRDITQQDATRMLNAMDENNDGGITYKEWTNFLADCSGATMIDDPSHWAYYLFEDIRRKVYDEDKGLAKIFGIANKPPGSNEKVTVAWNDFMKSLDRLNCRMGQD